jgi:hypothetical protein
MGRLNSFVDNSVDSFVSTERRRQTTQIFVLTEEFARRLCERGPVDSRRCSVDRPFFHAESAVVHRSSSSEIVFERYLGLFTIEFSESKKSLAGKTL